MSNDDVLPLCNHLYIMNAVSEGRISVLNSKYEVSETASVRILLVDDFEPFRTLVSSILKEQPGYQIVGEAADGLEAVQRAVECKPDLVVLDMDLPKLNGIEVARQIRRCSPDSMILFLTLNNDSDLACEVLRAGARGYVLKFDAVTELVEATKTVLSGKRFVGQALRGLGGFGGLRFPTVAINSSSLDAPLDQKVPRATNLLTARDYLATGSPATHGGLPGHDPNKLEFCSTSCERHSPVHGRSAPT